MKKSTRLVTAAAGSLLALGLSAAGSQALAAKKMEKCFGIVKAGQNDCQTATSSCAGTSTADGQKDASVLVPTGTCERLVGGTTTTG